MTRYDAGRRMGSTRQRAVMATVFFLSLAARSASPVAAQASENVAFIAVGRHGAMVGEALAGLLPDAVRLTDTATPEATPGLAYIVAIDTDVGVVEVYRHVDGARFERHFEAEAEDSYALALVASELLEVAQSGADPIALGLASTGAFAAAQAATVRAGERPPDGTDETDGAGGTGGTDGTDEQSESEREGGQQEADGAANQRPAPPSEDPSAQQSMDAGSATFELGVGIEAWTGFEDQSPWLVQPTLFFDVLWRMGPVLLVGAGLYGSGFGSYTTMADRATLDYRRYDLGGRVSAAFDAGPWATRLLAHLRAGAGIVIGEGRTLSMTNEETRSASAGSWFVGLGLEARQPLVAGLELTLEVGVDLIPAPITFIAFGETLAAEGPARLAGRLGLGWRIE